MRLKTALLATALSVLDATGSAQLLPAGKFKARDGRPGPGKSWVVTDEQGERLAARMNAIAERTPIVIDYDHQTLRAETNGAKAVAAGWIQRVEWRKGEGLWAQVEWTDTAKAHILAGEYRYISPVILHDEETGAVIDVVLAALLNLPAIVGMEGALAQMAADFAHFAHQSQPEGADMALLASLIAALGLSNQNATEAEALSAVSALRATAEAARSRPAVPAALCTALGVAAGADETAAVAAVTQLKADDTGALQAISALSTELSALRAQLQGDKVTAEVDAAIAAKKLLPAMKDWALNLGRKDLAALQTYIAAAPVLEGLSGQTDGRGPADGATAVDALSTKVAATFGLTAEQLAKAKPKS